MRAMCAASSLSPAPGFRPARSGLRHTTAGRKTAHSSARYSQRGNAATDRSQAGTPCVRRSRHTRGRCVRSASHRKRPPPAAACAVPGRAVSAKTRLRRRADAPAPRGASHRRRGAWLHRSPAAPDACRGRESDTPASGNDCLRSVRARPDRRCGVRCFRIPVAPSAWAPGPRRAARRRHPARTR